MGRRLANREYGERKINAFEGVPAMGLDGLGSSAYGPEAALTILIPLGAGGLGHAHTTKRLQVLTVPRPDQAQRDEARDGAVRVQTTIPCRN